MEHRDRLYEMLAKISDPKDIEKRATPIPR